MTESEYLASTDPAAMLEWIRLGNVAAQDDYPPNYSHCPIVVSDRKLRLWVEACRQMAFPDDHTDWGMNLDDPADLHMAALGWASPGFLSPELRAQLLREIVGNPFRPVKVQWFLSWRCPAGCNFGSSSRLGDKPPEFCRPSCGKRIEVTLPTHWLTPTVIALARGIDEGRECPECKGTGREEYKAQGEYGWETLERDCGKCHGTGKTGFDPSGMPQLVDALEEAGAPEEMVRHCHGFEWCPSCLGKLEPDTIIPIIKKRVPTLNLCCMDGRGWIPLRTTHVRGCWVISLILGEE